MKLYYWQVFSERLAYKIEDQSVWLSSKNDDYLSCFVYPCGKIMFITCEDGGHGEQTCNASSHSANTWKKLIIEAEEIIKHYWGSGAMPHKLGRSGT